MHSNSVIELNSTAYQNNIDFLKKTFGKKVILSAVIKGNAYGHDIVQFSTMAFAAGITHFSLFDVDEAKIAHDVLGNKATFMIMGFIPDNNMEWVVANNIEFFVFDKHRLTIASKAAKKLKTTAKVHI